MSVRLIAEIGQGHQGSPWVARDLIDMAADPRPADLGAAPHYSAWAVKLTKRDLDYELARSLMEAPYAGRHSFGATYREHRERLELSDTDHAELYAYAKSKGLAFVETLCAPSCVSLLKLFTPDALKVASRDLTNGPLLEALAETKLHVILSTGMADRQDLERALDIVAKGTSDITILHCLSQYPAAPEELNLSRIEWLRSNYRYATIGYSDHTVGIHMAVAAAALGAKVIEKHVTLDRMMRGSDHMGALERDGLWRLLRDLDELGQAKGTPELVRTSASEAARVKLERSIAAMRDIRAGEVITESDLGLLSPGTGLRWHERGRVIGRRAVRDIATATIIEAGMVEDTEREAA
jgi:sialic acid synthase